MAKIIERHPPRRGVGQREAPSVDSTLKRIGTGVQDQAVQGRPYTARSLADQRTRFNENVFDYLIRRDGVPQWLIQNYHPAGKPVNNWTAAGPARPTLWSERGQTLSPRSGNSVSRFLQNPAAPGTGLHTQVNNDASGARGSAQRYLTQGVPQMRSRRQNRLASAVYTGQSYSQTTVVQGAG